LSAGQVTHTLLVVLVQATVWYSLEAQVARHGVAAVLLQ